MAEFMLAFFFTSVSQMPPLRVSLKSLKSPHTHSLYLAMIVMNKKESEKFAALYNMIVI